MSSGYVVMQSPADEIEIPTDGILSKTYYEDDHVKVVVFGFSKGQELSEHTAARPAILQVVRGQAKVTLGDTEITVGEGGWFYLCPKQPHAIVAQEPLALMLVLTKP